MFGRVIYFSSFEETFMKNEKIKAEILQSLSIELDQLLEDTDKIDGAYDYEERYLLFARKMNRIVLQKIVGEIPMNRNKKNSIRV
jgi:hypothetical protein